MSIDHSVNSTVRDRGIVQRDVDQIKHVSDARLRSLEIMATIVSVIMILAPLAVGARSSMI